MRRQERKVARFAKLFKEFDIEEEIKDYLSGAKKGQWGKRMTAAMGIPPLVEKAIELNLVEEPQNPPDRDFSSSSSEQSHVVSSGDEEEAEVKEITKMTGQGFFERVVDGFHEDDKLGDVTPVMDTSIPCTPSEGAPESEGSGRPMPDCADGVDILKPVQICGNLIGAMLPYAFSAMTMKAVGDAAIEMMYFILADFKKGKDHIEK